jgi:type I restriction enzyme S subunit
MPDMGRLFLAMPPPDEQLTIVRRIEDATSTLDAAAEAALRQIASLREYRTRLVADVVTGKLDVREAAANLPEEVEEPEEPEEEGEVEVEGEGEGEAEELAEEVRGCDGEVD